VLAPAQLGLHKTQNQAEKGTAEHSIGSR